MLVSRGEQEQAEQVLTESRRVFRSLGFLPLALFAETQLARLELEWGDPARALAILERVVEESSGVAYAADGLDAKVWFAHAHARAGSPEIGLAALDDAVAAAGEEATQYAAATGRARAACLTALGRRDEAAACLESALESALQQGLLYEQMLIRTARLELGSAEGPEELRERDRLAQLLGLAE